MARHVSGVILRASKWPHNKPLSSLAQPMEKQQPYQMKKKNVWNLPRAYLFLLKFITKICDLRENQSPTRIAHTLEELYTKFNHTHTTYTKFIRTELTLSQNLYTADRFVHQNSVPMYNNRTHTHHTEESRNCSSAQTYMHCKNTIYRQ